MNRERIRWLAFGAISLALAAAALRTWWPRSWQTVLAGAAGRESQSADIELADELFEPLEREPAWVRSWGPKPWPPSPFPPPTFSDETITGGETRENPGTDLTSSRYVLQAILRGRAPVALLNGRLVTVGSRLPDGSTVEQINADSVVLATSGGRVEIPLTRSVQAERQEQSP